MQTFSRWMPPGSRELSNRSWLLLVALWVSIAAALFLTHPWLLLAIGALVVTSYVRDRRRRTRLRSWAAERHGEGLCTFARSLPRKQREPWVLRAVYDELQPHYKVDGLVVPPRLTDELQRDLEIDPDDLEDIVFSMARRVGREWESWDANPYRDRVHTVADLVALIASQARVTA